MHTDKERLIALAKRINETSNASFVKRLLDEKRRAFGEPVHRFDTGGDKDNNALGKAIAERVRREQEAKARAEGAPMMGEKPLESEDYLLGAAVLASAAPISGTVAAIKEAAPFWGKAGLRMLRDLPAFEFVDRLPTLVGGKRMTELGGDATQYITEKVAGKSLSPTGTMLARLPGEFIAGVIPGVAGDVLMRTGANAAMRSINAIDELNGIRNGGINLRDISSGKPAEFSYVIEEPVLGNPTAPVDALLAEAYAIENLGGGYMLKSLMRGNPLEKQIGKNGTVNVNNIRALINKGSKVEQAVVDKVLASEEFAGKKAIDYNKFRKAVQDELITYDRYGSNKFQDYGLERLGFNKGDKYVYGNWQKENGLLGTHTYTLESPRIPNGSAKHYGPNTLGHSRTYTTADEPDVLHVMESQSDWAQAGKEASRKSGINSLSRDEVEGNINSLRRSIARNEAILEEGIGGEHLTEAERFGINQTIGVEMEQLESFEQWLRDIDAALVVDASQINQEGYLIDNYTSRQIQENLRYAAERGQKKMRYPTRETAAKIEGYPEREMYVNEAGEDVTKQKVYTYGEQEDARLDEIKRELRRIETRRMVNYFGYDNDARVKDDELYVRLVGESQRIKSAGARLKPGIAKKVFYDHENILKRYSDFPKQFQKLFKGADVRTVTDAKGNTWYEADVPENYLQQEWAYADGGLLRRFDEGGDSGKGKTRFDLGDWVSRKASDLWYRRHIAPKIKELGIDEVRNRLYRNISPYSYVDVSKRLKSALDNELPEFEEFQKRHGEVLFPADRDDIFATYLQIPLEKRRWAGKNSDGSVSNNSPSRVVDSDYAPSVSSDNSQYKALTLDDLDKMRLVNLAIYGGDDISDYMVNNGNRLKLFPSYAKMQDVNRPPLSIGDNRVSTVLRKYFGPHTIGRGVDPERGEYISYYDKWDLAPFNGNGEDESCGIGKPIEFYDRIYLDDYFGIDSRPKNPDEFYGGYIKPVVFTGKKSKGGLIERYGKDKILSAIAKMKQSK